MSEIRVEKIVTQDGEKNIRSDAMMDGSAKAWAILNTVTGIKNSLNVSSWTDASATQELVSFTTAFNIADGYSTVTSSNNNASRTASSTAGACCAREYNPTNVTLNNSSSNIYYVSLSCYGELSQ